MNSSISDHTTLAPIDEIIGSSLEATPIETEVDTEMGEFPVDALPQRLRDMAIMVSASWQIPLSLACVAVLGCGSAAIGKGLEVQSKSHRRTRGNLMILATAESGSGKSDAIRVLTTAFERAEKRIRKKFIEETKPRLLAERARLEEECKPRKKRGIIDDASRADALRRIDEINKQLKMPQLMVGDVTTEKLLRVLEASDEAIFSTAGEARNIAKNLLGRYTKGAGDTDETAYLAGYSGDRFVCQRIHSGDTILESPCIAALWLMQPDVARKILASESLSAGGLVPRLCVADTNARRQKRTGDEPEFDHAVADQYDALIEDLIMMYRLREEEAFVIQPDADVVKQMRDYHNSTITDDNRYADVTPYVARWEENAWRIAVTLHAAEHGKEAHNLPLSGDTAARAIKVMDWFSGQQLELLSSHRTAQRDKTKAHVLEVITRKFTANKLPVTLRAVQQITRYDKDKVRAVVSELEQEGAIESIPCKPRSGPSFTGYIPKEK